MTQATFLLAVKAALEARVKTLAVALTVDYVDLDDTTQTPKILGKGGPALVYEFGSLEGNPMDPLYAGNFHVGGRLDNSPANYELLKLTGAVESAFPVGQRIEIFELFDEVKGPLVGIVMPGHTEVAPQTYDLLSGFRMVSIPFAAQRLLV